MLSYELQIDDGHGGSFRSVVGGAQQGPSLETLATVEQGIEEGGLYRFRWRASNVNGWSGFSPVAYIRAATRPGRPGAPILDEVDADGISVTVQRTQQDHGGSPLHYELWRNQGTGTLDYILVASYDGASQSHRLTVVSDALAPGQVYSLRTVAVNDFGAGEASEELVVGLAGFPAAPASLAKVAAESGTSYLTLAWAQSADTALPVLGYQLYMQDTSLGVDEFELIYDGTDYPHVRKFTVARGVVTGGEYAFRVAAVNFNGAGPASDAVVYAICTQPGFLAPPRLDAVTETTMLLGWAPPASDGGCRVLSYALLIDDGAGGPFAPLDPALVANRPTLRAYAVTSFTNADTSKTFRFLLQASNRIGATESREASFVLAAVPD